MREIAGVAAGVFSVPGEGAGVTGGFLRGRGVIDGAGVTFAGVGVDGVPMKILRKSDGFFGFGVAEMVAEGEGLGDRRIRGRGVSAGEAAGVEAGTGLASGDGVETAVSEVL